jgi:hypothetical protein
MIIMINNIVCCDLCLMKFDKTDPDFNNRISVHNIWHFMASIQKRNTTQGNPKYN